MTKAGYMQSMTKLVRDHERRTKQAKNKYAMMYDTAMTARDVLAANEWYDKEMETIRIWFCKRYEKLRKVEVTE